MATVQPNGQVIDLNCVYYLGKQLRWNNFVVFSTLTPLYKSSDFLELYPLTEPVYIWSAHHRLVQVNQHAAIVHLL